jgi:hypothetical protein
MVDPDARDESDDHDGVNRSTTRGGAMGVRIAGRCTDLWSCHTPCPCAFGQTPTGGTCAEMFCFEIHDGEYENVSLAGTRAIFADVFSGGPWMDGNVTAALILDANSTEEQRDALTNISSSKAGGDAANWPPWSATSRASSCRPSTTR